MSILFVSYIALYITLVASFFCPVPRRLLAVVCGSYVVFQVICLGFRDSSLGTDTEQYLYMYSLAQDGSFYPIEPLFKIFNWLCAYFLLPDRYYISLIYIIFISLFVFPICYGLKRDKEVVYFCVSSSPAFLDLGTNVLRQGLAIGCVFCGLIAFKRFSRLGWIGVASFFHYSAVSVLGVYVASFMTPKSRWFLATASIFSLIFISANYFYSLDYGDYLVRALSLIGVDDFSLYKLSEYTEGGDGGLGSLNWIGFLAVFLEIALGPFVFFMLFRPAWGREMVFICMLSIPYAVLSGFSYSFHRLNHYRQR